MMKISIQIDTDFEQISWDINAEGSGDAVIGRISMMQISMQIDAYFDQIS